MGAAQELIDEIVNDPNTRSYSGMTDQQIFDDLHNTTLGATRPRAVMTASEVYNQIVEAEMDLLSAEDQDKIWNILHLGDINPFGLEATVFQTVFGDPGSSTTVDNLQSARLEPISRVTQLGLSGVTVGEIHRARL